MTYLFSHPVVTLLVKDHTRNILHCGGLHTSEFSIKLEKKSGASRAKNFSFFFNEQQSPGRIAFGAEEQRPSLVSSPWILNMQLVS